MATQELDTITQKKKSGTNNSCIIIQINQYLADNT